MKTRHHIILASICIILWFLLFLSGASVNYFQDFTRNELILLLFITFFGILPFVTIVILTLIRLPFLKTSVWFAFYGSVLPLILDYIVVGIIQGQGFHFLTSHWYLTVGYVVIWIISPLVGKILEQLAIRVLDQRF